MERCPDCNSVLLKTETQCGCCGTIISRGRGGPSKFAALINVALLGTLGMTAATFFVEGLPPLSKCLPVCLILLMIRTTADQKIDTNR